MPLNTGGGWLDKIKQNWPAALTQMGGQMNNRNPNANAMASGFGNMAHGLMNRNPAMPGVNPSAGTPNNPFSNVSFGGATPPNANPMGMNTPPASGGMMGPQMGTPGISPMWQSFMAQNKNPQLMTQ